MNWPTGDARERLVLAGMALLLLAGPFAALATVVVTTAPGVFSLDAEIATRLHLLVIEHPGLGQTLRVVGHVTEPFVLRGLALLGALALWWRGQRRTAVWLMVTMAIGGLLGGGLKDTFTRDRPDWPDPVTLISGYSFPSGHALNSMLAVGCAIVLLYPGLGPGGRRLLLGGSAGFVIVVGLDRLALGVHYLTDVLAGWTLALVVVLATMAAFGRPDPAGRATPTAPPASATEATTDRP